MTPTWTAERSKRSRNSSDSLGGPNKAPRHGSSKSRMAVLSSSTGNDTELCDRCRAIDFTSIFEREFSRHDDRIITHLGEIDEDLVRSPCLLCSFFASLVISSGAGNNTQRASTYALRTFSAVQKLGFISNKNQRSMARLVESTAIGLVRIERSSSQRTHLSAQQNVLSAIGFIYPTNLSKFKNDPHIVARKVEPDAIDYRLLRDWIQRCCVHHERLCKVMEDETALLSLQVIDCATKRVVEASADCKYVALSYVWGNVDRQSDTQDTPGDNGQLPVNVPNVVSDAIELVQKLDLRYLWVDRYCINQSDEASKRETLRLMALIYNHAYITIIAAAGNDSSFGLPGVRRERIHQPTVEISPDLTLVASLQDPHEAVKQSVWYTRGWVYQEALFAIRRVIFTDQQVYYECNNMTCSEAISTPLDTLHTGDGRRFRTCVRHGIFRGGFGKRCSPLTEHIQKYSEKALTFETDILRGMLGIFRAFERQKFPIHHLWGVPVETDLDIATWQKQPTVFKQYLAFPWKLAAGFARGLSWSLQAPASRCKKFPSWSWTAWAGCLLPWPAFEALSRHENPEIQFYVELADGTSVDLATAYLSRATAGPQQRLKETHKLLIECWVVKLQFTYLPDYSEPPQSSQSRSQARTRSSTSFSSSSTSKVFAKAPSSASLGLVAFSALSICDSSGNIQDRLLDPSIIWEGIVLGFTKQGTKSPIVMVIERDHRELDQTKNSNLADTSALVYERVGLVDFFNSWAMDDRGRWKNAVVDIAQFRKEKKRLVLV